MTWPWGGIQWYNVLPNFRKVTNRFEMWNRCAWSMAISYVYFSAWNEKYPKMCKYYCTHPYITNSTQLIQKSRRQQHMFSRVVFIIYHCHQHYTSSAFYPHKALTWSIWFSQYMAIIFPNIMNQLFFVMTLWDSRLSYIRYGSFKSSGLRHCDTG